MATLDVPCEEQICRKGDLCKIPKRDAQFDTIFKAIKPELASMFPLLAPIEAERASSVNRAQVLTKSIASVCEVCRT